MSGRLADKPLRWATALIAIAVLLSSYGCSTPAQRLYRRAEAFFAQGKYQLSALEYNRIVNECSTDPLADDALYKLAYLYREELDNPAAAVQSYRYLVDRYPNSNYADDALLWIIYIGRRHLHSPDMVAATCREIDERFPDDLRLRAEGWLQVAGTYYDAGDTEKARQQCEAITKQFDSQRAIAAEAILMLANIARDESSESEETLELYERVIEQYADTAAAAKARQAVGWLYYDVKAKQDEQHLAQQRRQAHVLQAVAPIEPHPQRPAVELLAATRSLLQQAGAQVSLDEVMVVSGLAFTFCFDIEKPQASQHFYRHPLTLLAEELGFGHNLWTFAEMTNALAAVTTTLHNDRALLISYGKPHARAALITGYKPAEKQIYLALPGHNNVVVSEDKFAQQWTDAVFPKLWEPGLEAGYQFSLTTRRQRPAPTALAKAAILRATLALGQAQLLGSPAGRAGYQAFLDYIRDCLPANATASRDKLHQWAEEAIPPLSAARLAAARYLGNPRLAVPSPASVALAAASQSYERLAQQWQQLGTAIAQASSPPAAGDTETWTQILQDAESIARQEQQTLQDLASALGG